LSILGDEEGVIEALERLKNNKELSHRIIVEILHDYTGDLRNLSAKLLDTDDEYVKTSVVKALAKYKIADFQNIYLEFFNDGGLNLKVAAIRALGALGNEKYEQQLILGCHAKEWQIRAASVKSIKTLVTPQTLKAVADATKDNEWWVRYNAANSLIEMDKNLEYAEKILGEYDKYASDAVKHALYQQYYTQIAEGETDTKGKVNYKKKSIKLV